MTFDSCSSQFRLDWSENMHTWIWASKWMNCFEHRLNKEIKCILLAATQNSLKRFKEKVLKMALIFAHFYNIWVRIKSVRTEVNTITIFIHFDVCCVHILFEAFVFVWSLDYEETLKENLFKEYIQLQADSKYSEVIPRVDWEFVPVNLWNLWYPFWVDS